jgi:hypothetical protein
MEFELVIRSADHSVQSDPHTVTDLRRILLLDLAEARPQGHGPAPKTDSLPIAPGPTAAVQPPP